MVTVNTCNILIQTDLKTISQPHIHTYIHTFLRLYQHQARLPAINTDNDNDTNIDRWTKLCCDVLQSLKIGRKPFPGDAAVAFTFVFVQCEQSI